MSSKDTDPQWLPPVSKPGEITTEPGAEASRMAEDLLASLAKAPLPEEGVAETQGHDAASFVAGPHAPPARARDDTLEDQPAVVVNQTQPFGRPVTPAPVPLGTPPPGFAIETTDPPGSFIPPSAPPVDSTPPDELPRSRRPRDLASPASPPPAAVTEVEDAVTEPRRAPKKVLPITEPSARVKRYNRSLLLLAVVCGAAGVILFAAFSNRDHEPAPRSATPTVDPASKAGPPPLVVEEGPSAAAPTVVTPPPAAEPAPHKHDPPRKTTPSASASAPPPPTSAPAPRASSSSDFPWRQ
jgi:hypothetical protein